MLKRLNKMMVDEKGQGLVEYALILVLIALIVMAAVHTVGNSTRDTFCNINNGLNGQTP